jgi:hypothetical protein
LVTGQREVGGAELAGAVADERADSVGAFGLEHPDSDAGIALAEAADEGGHRVDRQGGQGGDLERAGGELEHAADRVAGLVGGSQDLPGGTDQRLAGLG